MSKSERLLNLLILLLVQRHYIPKHRIREMIPAYREASDDAFDRMFDRDKDELRALGAPVEVDSVDAYFDEPGYRIRAEDFALPGLDLTADEAAVVGLATRVWQHAGLAGATSDALAKLAAGGVPVDRSRLDIATPVVTAEDPHLETFWQSSLDRARMTFGYRSGGATEDSTRVLEPWGVVSFSGRWYVVGRDVDRDEERMFRLSRVRGKVSRVGRGGAFEVPPGTDLRELSRRLSPGPAVETARVLVRPGACLALRRLASAAEDGLSGPGGTTWDRLELPYSSAPAMADEVLSFGADACVEGPDELRALVVERLRATVARPA